jgi:hypothetical protein
MRDVPRIWDAWRSGVYVGDTKPSTRVTVEESFFLTPTGPVVGQWDRGPARWFQRADIEKQIETEIPGVMNVSINRSTEPDAGTCDITVRNVAAPTLGAAEMPPGQFSDIGYYTPDRGDSQEANARWGHAVNPWHEVIVPNALVRTYQGFGGQDMPIRDAVADGYLVLNGVWLVDDVTINTDGTIAVKCRDMAKLLIDQQLLPPLVPQELYPLDYRRYRIESYPIPADPPPGVGVACPGASYATGPGWHSSSDEAFGAYNASNTGHPPAEAFDISYNDPDWRTSGEWPVHQRSYWLSEPKGGPNDTVWIEFDIPEELGKINEIYFHAWKGAIEGRGCHLVMVSIMEYGYWVSPEWVEATGGGYTPQGIPYMSTFVPGTELAPGEGTNRFWLWRDFHADKVRLTLTNLIEADDFPQQYRDPDFHGGGWRGGARKIMACFNEARRHYPAVSWAATGMWLNDEERLGYWQTRTSGNPFAFGDARIYDVQDGMTHVADIVGMAMDPSNRGYFSLDAAGRVLASGAAQHRGDAYRSSPLKWRGIASTPSGGGYWLLRDDGTIANYGDASHYGNSYNPDSTSPLSDSVHAHSIESHPTINGYWVSWSNGLVTAHNLPHHGNVASAELGVDWISSIRRTSKGDGYRLLTAFGMVHCRGTATHHGNAPSSSHWETDKWWLAVCAVLLPSSSSDAGYMIQRLDGSLSFHGDYAEFGSIGAGRGELRYDGNYKDYSDIIRDLLLWAGFYFMRDPQPEGELPDVYGNIENTGAYSTNDPLPQDMFDKRPVIDAIRDIKAIVGYVFFIDAEGGARWEAPNWWQMGNWHMYGSADGTRAPFNYMPEIDETVQLTSHSVVRSGQAARSEIIIATQYPYSTVNGQKSPDGIVKTRIVGSSAPDLKGIISPFIAHNGLYLKPEEQQTMAEILDMQIWFQRRTASVNCVANPLIDVNDQVRIIERQTGEVYVHYIKAISFSHDLQTGAFTMSLTTYWLGGTPYGQLRLFYACAARPQGDGYWQISAAGEVYAYGAAELQERNVDDTHLYWPVAMRPTLSGEGYWSMDQAGNVVSYGDAAHQGELDRYGKDAIDFAITPTGEGYWILLLNGEIHTFGDAVNYGEVTLTEGQQAKSIESHPSTMGYWVVLSDGEVVNFNLPHHGDANQDGFKAGEKISRLRRTESGDGYWIISTSGIVQAFGDAPDEGSGIAYPEGPQGLVWDMLASPDGGYALQRADGTFEMFSFTDLGVARVSNFDLTWALVSQDAHLALGSPTTAFPISPRTMEFLKNTSSPSAISAAANDFNSPTVTALEGSTVS